MIKNYSTNLLDDWAPKSIDDAEDAYKRYGGGHKFWTASQSRFDRGYIGVRYSSMRDYRHLEDVSSRLKDLADDANKQLWDLLKSFYKVAKSRGVNYVWFIINPDDDYVSVYEYNGDSYTTREFAEHVKLLKTNPEIKGYVPNTEEREKLRRLWIRERTLRDRYHVVLRAFRAAIESRIRNWNEDRMRKLHAASSRRCGPPHGYYDKIMISININDREYLVHVQGYTIDWEYHVKLVEFTD